LVRTRTDAKASRSDWHLEVLPQHHHWALRDRITGTVIPLGVTEQFIQDHPADHTCPDCAASSSGVAPLGFQEGAGRVARDATLASYRRVPSS
jgi:hypothetical protein